MIAVEQAYITGFQQKCAEYGADPQEVVKEAARGDYLEKLLVGRELRTPAAPDWGSTAEVSARLPQGDYMRGTAAERLAGARSAGLGGAAASQMGIRGGLHSAVRKLQREKHIADWLQEARNHGFDTAASATEPWATSGPVGAPRRGQGLRALLAQGAGTPEAAPVANEIRKNLAGIEDLSHLAPAGDRQAVLGAIGAGGDASRFGIHAGNLQNATASNLADNIKLLRILLRR
jgi:hypothetical protein